jgi:hypothetical protein
MGKLRTLGGALAAIATVATGIVTWVPRAKSWAMEFIRAQIGEAAMHKAEIMVEGVDLGVLIPSAIVLLLFAGTIWLWWPQLSARVSFLGPRFMPLAEAARGLYERNTASGQAEMARHFGKSEEDIIDWFIAEVKNREGVTFYGKRIGSRQREKIPADKIEFLHPRNHGTELAKALVGGLPEYTDPEIQRSHYWKYVLASSKPSVFD